MQKTYFAVWYGIFLRVYSHNPPDMCKMLLWVGVVSLYNKKKLFVSLSPSIVSSLGYKLHIDKTWSIVVSLGGMQQGGNVGITVVDTSWTTGTTPITTTPLWLQCLWTVLV